MMYVCNISPINSISRDAYERNSFQFVQFASLNKFHITKPISVKFKSIQHRNKTKNENSQLAMRTRMIEEATPTLARFVPPNTSIFLQSDHKHLMLWPYKVVNTTKLMCKRVTRASNERLKPCVPHTFTCTYTTVIMCCILLVVYRSYAEAVP